MNPVMFWWIDSDEFWLPNTFWQVASMERQIEVFQDLHYNRYTYYPYHDSSRVERESSQQRIRRSV
jgi:hypothetical protein